MTKMSPYATLTYKGLKEKTEKAKSMGKNPEWNYEWTINVESIKDQVDIRLWNDSDGLAFAFVKVSAFMCNNGIEDWHKLYYDTKVGGKILISSHFEPMGGDI